MIFKGGRCHLLNGVTHTFNRGVVWPLPHFLSSPPYFVSLLITKMKNCTFIWFLYLIFFYYYYYYYFVLKLFILYFFSNSSLIILLIYNFAFLFFRVCLLCSWSLAHELFLLHFF